MSQTIKTNGIYRQTKAVFEMGFNFENRYSKFYLRKPRVTYIVRKLDKSLENKIWKKILNMSLTSIVLRIIV